MTLVKLFSSHSLLHGADKDEPPPIVLPPVYPLLTPPDRMCIVHPGYVHHTIKEGSKSPSFSITASLQSLLCGTQY